jgi:hypothetical protein
MRTTTEVDGMARRARQLRWVGTTVAIAIALAAFAAVSAETVGGPSPVVGPRSTTAAPQRAGAATGPAGLERRDAVVAAAIAAGVLLLGFRGYVVVGAAIAAVTAVLGVGARLVTGEPKRHAWKDWPSPPVARVAQQNARDPRPAGRPKAEPR